ncbi:MAG: hypothetical protein AB8B63_17270 [Granulosicoccus sp.]
MIERRLFHEICARLGQMPAVAILGPRQTGKTTLALEIENQQPSLNPDKFTLTLCDGSKNTFEQLEQSSGGFTWTT